MSAYTDLSGQMFGQLMVVKRVADYVRPNGKMTSRHLCLCSCGKTAVIRTDFLTNGHSTSCGCSRGRKGGNGIKVCVYNPIGVNCTKLECNNCGWNPCNTKLRKARINKLLRKDGKYE